MSQTLGQYNDIGREYIDSYVKSLVNKIYKMLPMKEEKNPHFNKYHQSLMFELTGFCSIAKNHIDKALFISVLSSIESLKMIDDMPLFKRKIFECINSVERVI